jgi:two-component system, NarL family, response regulator NreC
MKRHGFRNVLTNREHQVLCLVGQAKTTKEVASLLNLSVHTIGSHRRRLCAKLNLRSSTELAMYAINVTYLRITELGDRDKS